MHTAVVKLDALTNSVRTRAKDHDLLAIRRTDFADVFPCRVVVRGFRIELGTARVDGFVGGFDAFRPAGSANVGFWHRPQVSNLSIGETKLLGPLPLTRTHVINR